jgi:hypothetical protein
MEVRNVNDDLEFAAWGDAMVALAELVGRSGASTFEVFEDEDGRVLAVVHFQGARVMMDGANGNEVALKMATRLLTGAQCKCTKLVTLDPAFSKNGCHWRLEGRSWQPGCDAPPIRVAAHRGDISAMTAAMDQRERLLRDQ